MAETSSQPPELWREHAPYHFDLLIPAWSKILLIVVGVIVSLYFFDGPIAGWALRTHPIPDLADPLAKHGDIARELMWLEQWGQGVCSVVVILAVALLDRAGRRRALALAIACILTALLTHLLKDLCGRNRPYVDISEVVHAVASPGAWIWGGPAIGFTKGSSWGSFPSAHTTAAFALSAGLSWFYPKARGFFMTLALITAVQRVLHSAHYLSDVIAGLGIGVFVTRSLLHLNIPGRLIALAPPQVQRWWLQQIS